MKLSTYTEVVRQGVRDAASLADETTQGVAERLGRAVESSTRLALIRALSDATAEISSELAPGSVEVRIQDNEPEFVVSVPHEGGEPTVIMPPEPEAQLDNEPAAQDDADEPTARISLRLSASVKARVDEAADREGVSTNTWLTRAVQAALPDRRSSAADPSGGPQGVFGPSGFGQIFGPNGPFGPQGVFGAHGVFGEGRDPRAAFRPDRGGQSRGRRSGPGGKVQGWVR